MLLKKEKMTSRTKCYKTVVLLVTGFLTCICTTNKTGRKMMTVKFYLPVMVHILEAARRSKIKFYTAKGSFSRCILHSGESKDLYFQGNSSLWESDNSLVHCCHANYL